MRRCNKVGGLRFLAATCGLLVAGLGIIGQARAGCANGVVPDTKGVSGKHVPAVYHPTASAAFIRVADNDERDDWGQRRSIVGLWEFEFRLNDGGDGGKGTLFDWGLATWHIDGTEIQFSGARTPAAGDVCMGVWRREGHSFKLNHIALGLTPPTATGTFVGPTQIHAIVTLDESGNYFKGPQELTVYPGSPADGTEFDTKGTPIAVFSGTITAKRVKVDD